MFQHVNEILTPQRTIQNYFDRFHFVQAIPRFQNMYGAGRGVIRGHDIKKDEMKIKYYLDEIKILS